MRRSPDRQVVSRIAGALLSLLIPISAPALDPSRELSQYVHDVWEIEDGLPQNSVHAITQDRDGFLWLATLEGLVRFDGVRFDVYTKANVDALASNEMRSFHQDNDGTLWVGSYGGGLLRLSGGRFRSYGSEDGLDEDRVWQISGSREAGIWLATHHGLYRYKDGEFSGFTRADGLAGDDVRCVHADRDGKVWAGTMHGLSLYEDGAFRTFTTADGLAHDKVKSILRDSRGRLWVGTHTGVNLLENGSFTTFKAADGLAHDSVVALFEDRAGTMWIGTEGGLSRHLNGRIESVALQQPASPGIIRSFHEDHEGSLWIGTESGGLHRLRLGKFTPYTRDTGLRTELVWSLFERRDGSLAIGTNDGLALLRDGRFDHYTREAETSSNRIAALFESRDGKLWAGTHGDGLYLFQGDRFRPFPGWEQLAGDYILSMNEDAHGSLWIGTRAGLRRLKDGRVTSYGRADGLPGEVVRCIYPDPDGSLWIGTGSGLSRFEGGRFRNYSTADGLSSDAVFSIHRDGSGTLWLGTYGGGLNRFRDGSFHHVTTKEGLFDDVVYIILEDDRHNLWMSGNKGVFRIDKRAFNAYVEGRIDAVESPFYGVADGMMSRECNGGLQPAGFKTADGRMWFPTIRGPVAVDPGRLRRNTVAPQVHVTRVSADGVDLAAQGDVVVEPGLERLEVHYTALSFEVPRKVLFRYMLEGYDSDWIDAGTRRVAYYTNLSPGDYVFRVMACNNDGVWNEAGASLPLRKRPYFHETAGFTISLVALGLLALFSIFRMRIRSVEKRKDELEAIVQMRTEELKEATLRDSLTGLRNRRFVREIVQPDTEIFVERKNFLLRHEGPRASHPIDNYLGIFLIDIDHFKKVNDTHGHDAGDRILRQFAEVLSGALRKDDVVVRWGGEEFLVVLKHTSYEYIERFADKIRNRVARTEFYYSENAAESVHKTCSVGYVPFPFHPEDPDLITFEQAIMLADLGLYHSKRNGRNMSVGVLPTMAIPDAFQRAKMLASLRYGLENGLVTIRTRTLRPAVGQRPPADSS